MDDERFDAIAKTLATYPTRRAALRLLAGGLGGWLASTTATLITLAPDLAEAKNKKNKNTKKRKCIGGKVKCGKGCMAKKDCCVRGERIMNSMPYKQCAYCINGDLIAAPYNCFQMDPEGCTVCNEQTFNCEPGNANQTCQRFSEVDCGVCRGGLCEPDGRKLCGGKCCDKGADCCAARDGSQVCSAPHPTCGSCMAECTGGKCCAISQICCRAADYTEHCISPGGTC